MTVQTINLGAYANDGTGDDLRTAFQKVNANFAQLFAEAPIVAGTNLGTGAAIYSDKQGTNLEFKTITSDNTITITSTANTVNLSAQTTLANDPFPELGRNLNLNGHIIGDFNGVLGGSVNARIWNYDIQLLVSLVEVMTKSINVDFGSILNPTTSSFATDFGVGFSFASPPSNNLDFGTFV